MIIKKGSLTLGHHKPGEIGSNLKWPEPLLFIDAWSFQAFGELKTICATRGRVVNLLLATLVFLAKISEFRISWLADAGLRRV